MRVKPSKAASLFFPSTSLEFVYFEAIANSIDANASQIEITVDIPSFSDSADLTITITDNGDGFTDRNFEKFNTVLDVEDDQHKGIGRLVFLNYFSMVEIESSYDGKRRKFVFDERFDGEHEIHTNGKEPSKTSLVFKGYKKDKVKTYDYLVPNKILESITEHFLPQFYRMKRENRNLKITVKLKTVEPNKDYGFYSGSDTLNIAELPELKERIVDDPNSLFDSFRLLYSIEEIYEDQSVISAICADGRTIPMEIISNKSFPFGYKMVFILFSDYFDGKTSTNRESLDLDDATLRHVRKMFTKLVSQVISEEIPEIEEHNDSVKADLQANYPHLTGYFDSDSVGLVDKERIVDEAQSSFFKDQKKILEATHLDDEQYTKSLEYSSRILAEYILYRKKIINKLKEMTADNDESEIHDLIAPRRKKFLKENIFSDSFTNNAWVLDDKYISYSKVLSDNELETIYGEMQVEGSHAFGESDRGRPDITIVFSSDIETTEKVDVVIIEFKKLGLKLAEKEEVVSQLKQRARRLLEFYPERIQRIWFYGIIDFDNELRASLTEQGFTQLFSSGELFYKNQDIVVNFDTQEQSSADLFVLSYDSMLDDAEVRNSAFLNILIEGIRKDQAKT